MLDEAENGSDWIPDMPTGPLDQYRKQASFNWKRLKLVLERNPRLLKTKYHIWKTLEDDPLFAHSLETLTTNEHKHKTAMRVKRINEFQFVPEHISSADYKTKTRHLMTVNEALQAVDPNFSVKMAIGIHLFNNTLLALGTERHLPIFKSCWNRDMLSSVCLTEVAHGSNTKSMRTTATYDPLTEEFIVNTPDFEAAKCWIGNLGKTCTYSLVFAQLYTADGTCHGVHGFVIPIRDPNTLSAYPGLIIGDMGEKIGLNGIDNGFIMFQNYRIKRECLLNRIGDVTRDGEYESSFTEPTRILCAALETLSTGRVGIIQESVQTLTSAVTIAIRYAALRKQFGCQGTEEIAIINYPLHQWRLFPLLAAATVFKLYIAEFTDAYLNTVQRSNAGEKFDELNDTVSEIHAIVSATKPLITWTVLHATQECREACGGHGYLKSANLGDLRNNHDATVTYEGDNNVLSQQASNWLLRQLDNIEKQSPVSSPLKTASFLNNMDELLKTTFDAKCAEDVMSEKFIMSAYQRLICWLLIATNDNMNKEISKGYSRFEARCNSQVYKSSLLSKIYAEYVVLHYCGKVILNIEPAFRPVLNNLFVLYGLWSLDKHLPLLYQSQYSGSPKLTEFVREAILATCAKLRPEAVSVVDALAHPDFVINSVLGKSDGKLYQNLQTVFFHNPGAMERPSWWRDILKSKI